METTILIFKIVASLASIPLSISAGAVFTMWVHWGHGEVNRRYENVTAHASMAVIFIFLNAAFWLNGW